MRWTLVCLFSIAGCGGESLPTPVELYGNWRASASANTDGVSRLYDFSPTARETHPELEGLTDVYVLTTYVVSEDATSVASGQFSISTEDDALVTVVVSGEGEGSTIVHRIVEWVPATSLTIWHPSTGELTFEPLLL